MSQMAITTPIFTTTVAGYELTLERQKRRTRYAVRYGKQYRTNLTYVQAAQEFGLCLMHGLTCEGKADASDPNP